MHRRYRKAPAFTLAMAAALVVTMARSGHELPVYPSYYPHEIEIRTIQPEDAGSLLRAGKLHAYVGQAPNLAPVTSDAVSKIESLGSLVVLRINPESPLAKDAASACVLAGGLLREVEKGADAAGFAIHPYPVTPWHGDYLYHADQAAAARERILGEARSLPIDVKVRPGSALARSLLPPERIAEGSAWHILIEEIDISHLVADAAWVLNGWLGPRWVRSGWFHAYRILGAGLSGQDQARMRDAVALLQSGDEDGGEERINLQRELVQSLASGCHTMVAGYTLKREFFNAGFSAGIENIAFDALEGFMAPMFLRTVKLKEFPWNGSLRLGVGARPDTAWNPAGGFTDPFSRLAWYAIADPAAIPSPYEEGWILNRISEIETAPRK